MALRQQSKFDDALKAYQRAIEYSMRYDHPALAVRPYNSMGTIYIMQKEYDKGLAACQRALELDQKTGNTCGSTIMNKIAVAYFRQNQFDKSIAAFEKALEYGKNAEGGFDFSSSLQTWHNMGGVYEKSTRMLQKMLRSANAKQSGRQRRRTL